jgi:hypothetical protein
MTAAAHELQKAIFVALEADAALAALLGGPKIYDHAPADVAFPYVTFGRTSIFDWSTDTESGSELLFTLHVWSKRPGKREALAVIEAIRAVLDDAALDLDSHHLASLRLEFAEARYDEEQAVYHGLARFRALVELAG